MAKEKGEVVAVVREWNPQNSQDLGTIHDTIDAWGRPKEAPAAPRRDYAAIEAAVDRITKRVKARKVTVQETVTEYVDADAVEFTEEGPWDGAQAPAEDAAAPAVAPAEGQAKRGWLGWLKPAKNAKAEAAPAAAKEYEPQCGALTEDGAQCRNSARHGSKYCASHKGYQPPTAKGIAKRVEGEAWDPNDKVTDHSSVRRTDTRPKVRKAKDTKVAVRKAPSRKAAKKGGRNKR